MESICETGKVAHPTLADALKVKKIMKKRHKETYCYKCDLCGYYHLTSRKKSRNGGRKSI